MLNTSLKTPNFSEQSSRNTNLMEKLRYPLRSLEDIEKFKSHNDSETDLSLTNSIIRVDDRSISPLEKQKGVFPSLQQLFNIKQPMPCVITSQQPNQKYKTELCKNYHIYGYCKWSENCFFAHGKFELKSKVPVNNFYKTKICKHFHKNGFCPYSSRCQYFHFKGYQIYIELLDSFENKLYCRIYESDQNLDNMMSKFERMQPRLDVFKGLARGDTLKSLKERFTDNEF